MFNFKVCNTFLFSGGQYRTRIVAHACAVPGPSIRSIVRALARTKSRLTALAAFHKEWDTNVSRFNSLQLDDKLFWTFDFLLFVVPPSRIGLQEIFVEIADSFDLCQYINTNEARGSRLDQMYIHSAAEIVPLPGKLYHSIGRLHLGIAKFKLLPDTGIHLNAFAHKFLQFVEATPAA